MKPEKRLTPTLRKMFPDDFYWGASISSHQVEGGTYNQWTKFELDGAKEFALDARRRWSWIPAWKDVKDDAMDPDNYVSGRGIDHYKNYKKDLGLLKPLGLNAFRFSIEWSRIEPEQGVYNLAALRHYKEYIAELRRQGIEPMVTIWHWTLPIWFDNLGGFSKSNNLQHWKRFVEKICDELDWSGVKYVQTLNEVNTYVGMSYLAKEFPHKSKHMLVNLYTAVRTYQVLAKAHKIAFKALKLRHGHLQVSVAHQINKIAPKRPDKWLDKANAWLYMYGADGWFMGKIKRHLDYVGLNYYFTDYRYKLHTFPSENPSRPLNDLGWYMEPAGIESALLRTTKKFDLPIIIMENGVADMQDQYRLWWISETMHAVADAMRKGSKVIGYMHWSLLDNFEWQYGWFPKFGLIGTDRHTKARTLKKSTKAWSTWLRHR